jgi:hypothetical protein
VDEHLIGRSLEENKALLERLFWYTVGVVNLIRRSGELKPGRAVAFQEIGTGAACQYQGTRFILTAKHVLEDAGPSDLRFLPRPSGRIEWADEPGRTRIERVALDIKHIVRCEWEDLAAIVLGPSSSGLEFIQFCDLPDKFSDPPEQETCVVVGYPYDRTFIAEISQQKDALVHNLSAKSDAFWSEVVKTDRLLSGFDPNLHFLLRFYPSFPGERPDGYSGAGVWFRRMAVTGRELWSPDLLLTGILTHAYKNLGLLRIVRSVALRMFLEQTFLSAE